MRRHHQAIIAKIENRLTLGSLGWQDTQTMKQIYGVQGPKSFFENVFFSICF